MCFESSTVTLPSATQTMSGTQLPAWVSAGGKALFEKSASLVEPKFDEQGNYISKFQYSQPKIASYQDISYDYNKDGTVDIADQNLATKAGETANANAIAASLSGTTPLPMSKLTEEEQMAGDLLKKDDYSNLLTKAEGFTDKLGLGYLGKNPDGTDKTYQDLSKELAGEEFKIGEGTEAQKYLDIYSSAMDPAIRDIQTRTLEEQNRAREMAARSGGAYGSRLGIQEAMLGSEGIQNEADLRARGLAEGLGFAAGRFDTDRASRLAVDAATRGAYETEEASKLRAQQSAAEVATLTKTLQDQAAAGLISSGEAKRILDQQALDLAYADFLDQRREPYEDINFLLGNLAGIPYDTKQYAYNLASQTSPGPSVYGQTLGALGTLGSAYFMGRNR
jgi:hypothetical protein